MSAKTPDSRRKRLAAVRVAAGILVSRVLGLVRENALGYFFGAGVHADAWRAGLKIPNVIQNLLGEGALSASFIPVYVRLLEEGREQEAARVAGAILGILCLVAGGLAAIGAWMAPLIGGLIAPGFAGDGSAGILAAILPVLFPMTAFLVISAWALGILNSHRRFFVSYVAPALWNVAIVTALAAAAWRGLAGTSLLMAMAWGALAGGALQLLFQLPFAAPHLRGMVPSLGRGLAPVRRVIRNFVPVAAARGAVNLSALAEGMMASFLATGALSILGYAQTLYLLPISLFAMSIAAAELPELARDGAGEVGAVRGRTRDAVARLLFWMVPSAVAYLAFGTEITAILRLAPAGEFDAGLAAAVGFVLGAYALGLPASGSSRILAAALHALGDTRTPARAAWLRIALSLTTGLVLMHPLDQWTTGGHRMGAVGLALGATAGAWLEITLLARALGRRVEGAMIPWRTAVRTVVAAAPAVPAGILARALVPTPHPLLATLSALLPFGVAYIALAEALDVSPLRIRERLARRRDRQPRDPGDAP